MVFLLRLVCACLLLPGLSACFSATGNAPSIEGAGSVFNFGWRLSGEPRIGPMQVFDNGKRTWLQFAPGQQVPAVFGRRQGQEQLLLTVRSGQFQLLQGVWPELVFRAGHGRAWAIRLPGSDVQDAQGSRPGRSEQDAVSSSVSVPEFAADPGTPYVP
ncbi:TrbG/VirB9 family P-type conjugative transfer protein [Alcaligenes sp. SDU_A2]|uniref:TrbG/VirB9 family P-type conjugative transfer protein n=1 Tax=Alcaligenes sp. SDU_A2 TaxID=3136634 RepID=UPI002CC37D09|nr:TrbG/VirB9 family P-type conjugative transfer protein [Alcaligenes sp.]HRL27314.1 TrbG/VirB9 family P-type conjugative transfer protein [Alcaligenes sp.]